MAKTRTRRAAATLPPVPRGLRTASPVVAKKLLASINHCVFALDYQRKTLRRNLGLVKRDMPPDLRRQYTRALADLDKAHALVAGIDCAGPFMSFELPLLLGQIPPASKARTRRR